MISVLVVDDDVDLAEMVALVLSRAGMQVSTLTKGGLLFETLAVSSPDIILMDIYLGDEDGRRLCSSLKRGKNSKTPVILYSAGHITASSVRESGADAFIPKPFSIEQIIEKINTLVS